MSKTQTKPDLSKRSKVKRNFNKVAKAVAKGAGDVLQGKSVQYGIGTAIKEIANHPEWYTKLQVVSTNLNFNQQRGSTNHDFFMHPVGVTIPVVLNRPFLDLVPDNVDVNSGTVASAAMNSEAFDTATSLLYSTIRSVNAGNINYSIEEFRLYILNALSFHAAYNHYARAVRILQSVDVYDRLTPEPMYRLFSGQSADYAMDIANVARSRDNLNLLSKQLCAIYPLPPMTILEKIKFMFSNVFGDIKSVKESYFGYTLGGITNWDDDGKCLLHQPTSGLSESIQYLSTMMYKDRNNRALIAGDILKAFGTQIVDEYQFIDARDTVHVVVDEYAKEQFCNTVTYDVSTTGPKLLKLPKEFGFIYCRPIVDQEGVNEVHNVIVNAPFDTVPMGQALSITSNTSPYTIKSSDSGKVVATPLYSDGMSFGPASIGYFSDEAGIGFTKLEVPSIWYQFGVFNDNNEMLRFLSTLTYSKMLGIFPQVITLVGLTLAGSASVPVSDISNFAIYTDSQARSFSTQRVLSLYNVNTKYEKKASLAIL